MSENSFVISVTTDIHAENVRPINVGDPIQAGDSRAHIIRVKLMRDGVPFAPSPTSKVIGYFQTALSAIPISVDGSISGSICEVALPDNVYASEGRVVCLVRLISTEGGSEAPTITIGKVFAYVVKDVATEGSSPSVNAWTVPQVEAYVERVFDYVDRYAVIDSTVQRLDETVKILAALYNKVGYTLIAANGLGMLTDTAAVGVQITKIESGIRADGSFTAPTGVVITGANMLDPSKIESGSISTTSGADTTSSTRVRCSVMIPVKPSTQYRFYVGTSGLTSPNVIFYDAEGTRVGYSSPSLSGGMISVLSSSTARFMRWSAYSGSKVVDDIKQDPPWIFPATIISYTATTRQDYHETRMKLPEAITSLDGFGWASGTLCNRLVRDADGRWLYEKNVGQNASGAYEILPDDQKTRVDVSGIVYPVLYDRPFEAYGNIFVESEVSANIGVNWIRSII